LLAHFAAPGWNPDALHMALRERPQSLRLIANRRIDKCEESDIPSIREPVDRLDGKAAQV
jgi:hypothetical protein